MRSNTARQRTLLEAQAQTEKLIQVVKGQSGCRLFRGCNTDDHEWTDQQGCNRRGRISGDAA